MQLCVHFVVTVGRAPEGVKDAAALRSTASGPGFLQNDDKNIDSSVFARDDVLQWS